MADPQHVEALDAFDRLTVAAYRFGLVLAALGVGGFAAAQLRGTEDAGWRWALYAAVGLVVAHLHLYHRGIRWFIGAAGWIGAVLALAAPVVGGVLAPWLADAGLGFAFVVLSAAALKERYCFRVPIVVLVPPLLAGSLVPLRMAAGGAAGALLAGAAAVLALLALAKLAMPLRYDIGDKRRYQV